MFAVQHRGLRGQPCSTPSPSCQAQNKPIGESCVFANRGCEPCGPGLISLRSDWPSGWVSFRERTELNAKEKHTFYAPGVMQLAVGTKRSARRNGSLGGNQNVGMP